MCLRALCHRKQTECVAAMQAASLKRAPPQTLLHNVLPPCLAASCATCCDCAGAQPDHHSAVLSPERCRGVHPVPPRRLRWSASALLYVVLLLHVQSLISYACPMLAPVATWCLPLGGRAAIATPAQRCMLASTAVVQHAAACSRAIAPNSLRVPRRHVGVDGAVVLCGCFCLYDCHSLLVRSRAGSRCHAVYKESTVLCANVGGRGLKNLGSWMDWFVSQHPPPEEDPPMAKVRLLPAVRATLDKQHFSPHVVDVLCIQWCTLS